MQGDNAVKRQDRTNYEITGRNKEEVGGSEMNTTNKVILTIGGSGLVGLICFYFFGAEGLIFGSLSTLLVILFFMVWKKAGEERNE
jgi:hypothetical protein